MVHGPLDEISSTRSECAIRLIRLSQEFGIDLELAQAHLCLQHLDLVLDENRTTNLTRIIKVSDALVLHILDSLLLSRYMNLQDSGIFLDMGTGAGYPGIPLHILTGWEAVLVDAVRKKTDAISRMIQRMGLSSISVHHARLEDFARTHRDAFPCVVARAVASLPTLIELAAPFLSRNGRLIVSKGNPDETEQAKGMQVAALLGFSLLQRDAFELPDNYGHRSVLIYQKTDASLVEIPRRIGLAKKKPLA